MKQIRWVSITGILILLLTPALTWSQTIAKENLASALRSGGYVIVMRHASSPRQLPTARTANPDNLNRERQLDETGRRQAQAMGKALRRLRIPIGKVLCSPAYRALETAHQMGFTGIDIVDELGNKGMRVSRKTYVAWLRANVTQPPASGNRLLITHGPNVAGAFPKYTAGMKEGEALIFHPDGKGGTVMTGRIRITDWPDL